MSAMKLSSETGQVNDVTVQTQLVLCTAAGSHSVNVVSAADIDIVDTRE